MSVPGRVVGGGIGTIIVVLVALYLGVDPRMLLDGGTQPGMAPDRESRTAPPAEDRLADFVSVVLADTEDTWGELFARGGSEYRAPTLVLFSGAVQSACGVAGSAVGPFYCPADGKVYIDLSFYQDLQQRFQAPGDFAQAYVIAHEVGHHVQNLLGTTSRVDDARRRLGADEANRLSVMVELQADCLAGVWAHHAERSRHVLEAGDVEEALGAASAIGDDRIQRETTGEVVPDSFTHGTSAQRVRWFRTGLDTGDVSRCDTFKADSL